MKVLGKGLEFHFALWGIARMRVDARVKRQLWITVDDLVWLRVGNQVRTARAAEYGRLGPSSGGRYWNSGG